MNKERRAEVRRPVGLDAVVNYRTVALIGTIRDISLKGAFFETLPDELPYKNTPVELSLTLSRNGETRSHRIPARIQRVADDGAGLSFGDLERDAYFDLVSLVYPETERRA
jgi:hypothetical protein